MKMVSSAKKNFSIRANLMALNTTRFWMLIRLNCRSRCTAVIGSSWKTQTSLLYVLWISFLRYTTWPWLQNLVKRGCLVLGLLLNWSFKNWPGYGRVPHQSSFLSFICCWGLLEFALNFRVRHEVDCWFSRLGCI